MAVVVSIGGNEDKNSLILSEVEFVFHLVFDKKPIAGLP
jgi:hypothetical protein